MRMIFFIPSLIELESLKITIQLLKLKKSLKKIRIYIMMYTSSHKFVMMKYVLTHMYFVVRI